MNDLTSYDVFRRSEESFEMAKYTYRPALIVRILPRPTRIELWMTDKVIVDASRGLANYRVDQQPAVTTVLRYAFKEPGRSFFADPERLFQDCLNAKTVKIQYPEAYGPDRVLTYQLDGLRSALLEVCRKDSSLGCDDAGNQLGRFMQATHVP